MSKNYHHDPQLVAEVAKDTAKVEAKYQRQQAAKRQKKTEKEELEQQWVAPLLLLITLVIGFLVMKFF